MKKILTSLILTLVTTTILTNQTIINKNNQQIIEKNENMEINYKEKFIEEIKDCINNLGTLPEDINKKLNQLIEKINNYPNNESVHALFKIEFYMSLAYFKDIIIKTSIEKGNIAAGKKNN